MLKIYPTKTNNILVTKSEYNILDMKTVLVFARLNV